MARVIKCISYSTPSSSHTIVQKSSEDSHQVNRIIISNDKTEDGVTYQILLEFMYKYSLAYAPICTSFALINMSFGTLQNSCFSDLYRERRGRINHQFFLLPGTYLCSVSKPQYRPQNMVNKVWGQQKVFTYP